jgi:hypothetical protein
MLGESTWDYGFTSPCSVVEKKKGKKEHVLSVGYSQFKWLQCVDRTGLGECLLRTLLGQCWGRVLGTVNRCGLWTYQMVWSLGSALRNSLATHPGCQQVSVLAMVAACTAVSSLGSAQGILLARRLETWLGLGTVCWAGCRARQGGQRDICCGVPKVSSLGSAQGIPAGGHHGWHKVRGGSIS